MKKIVLLILFINALLLAQDKVGTTAANFLTLPVGPRAVGMGSAFIAVSNDVTAAFWNPGGLARLEGLQFNVNHSEWLVDTKLDWVGLNVKVDDANAIAVSIYKLDYGSDRITTVDQPMGTGQMWDASDLAMYLSYSRNLTDRFSIGGSFKYIRQQIWNESASAFALDIGLLYQTQFEGLSIGASIQNFGTEMKLDGQDLLRPIDIDESQAGNNDNITAKLDTDSWELPLIFSVGVAYDILHYDDWSFTIATDARIPNNENTYINTGFEFAWNDMCFIRGGYSSLFKEYAEEGISAGIGIKYKISDFSVLADFSYSDYGKFGDILKYSISIIL